MSVASAVAAVVATWFGHRRAAIDVNDASASSAGLLVTSPSELGRERSS